MDEFEWFDYQGIEDLEVQTVKKERSAFERSFEWISALMFFTFSISFTISLVFKYTLEDDLYFEGVNITEAVKTVMTISGSFRVILLTLFVLRMCISYFGYINKGAVFDKIYRYVTIFLWSWFCSVKTDLNAVSIFHSLMITSLVYGLLTFLMLLFQSAIIESAIKIQAKLVESTEHILHSLKQFVHEHRGAENSSESMSDAFCIDFCTLITSCITCSEHLDHSEYFGIGSPEVRTLKDAIFLARDVFNKASLDHKTMTFWDLKSAFKSEDDFENSRSLFNLNLAKPIDAHEFRDMIIALYNKRALLSKSIGSKLQFARIVQRLAFSTTLVMLCAVYFIIFGANVKELATLGISSAIVVSLVGSNVVHDLWRCIMFVISHQFDIGDEVEIDGREMTVLTTGVLSSSFILKNGGKMKISNSDLWKKLVINMTSTPEHILAFTFELKPDISENSIHYLKKEIRRYLSEKSFDFLDSVVFDITGTNCAPINSLKATVLLKCRNYNCKSKKFMMRIEFNTFLIEVLSRIK